jgi:hypothetical protein
MTATERFLTPHVFTEKVEFQEYCLRLPELFFKKNVPKDVVQNFEVIEQLLAHSYHEYRFIDEAYTKALQTFEMAMDIRYKELTNTGKDLEFSSLIERLTKLNQFDTDVTILRHLKWMRNHYSHPKRHSFAGIMLWGRISFVILLINEMYEDTKLRIERKKLEKEFALTQNVLNLDQEAVMETGQKKISLYRLQLLFIDNKLSPPTYHFSYTPLFELKSEGDSHIFTPQSYYIALTDVCFEDRILKGKNINTDKPVAYYCIPDETPLKTAFIQWHHEYKTKKQVFMYESSILRNNNDIYLDAFWKFLKYEN